MLRPVIKLTPFIAKFSFVLRRQQGVMSSERKFCGLLLSDGGRVWKRGHYLCAQLQAVLEVRGEQFSHVKSVFCCAQVFALISSCRSFTGCSKKLRTSAVTVNCFKSSCTYITSAFCAFVFFAWGYSLQTSEDLRWCH